MSEQELNAFTFLQNAVKTYATHKPEITYSGGCDDSDCCTDDGYMACVECDNDYPCQDIKILNEIFGESPAITLADMSAEQCTLCKADLSYAPYNELVAAIARVRELHKPYWNEQEFCDCCDLLYPCPTIKALDGEK